MTTPKSLTTLLLRLPLMAAVLVAATSAVRAEPLPRVQKNGTAMQLMVDDKPWIALAGEVHNSTASSATYMAPIWDRLDTLSLNTVVTPAYWESVEPQEGRFDFGLIDEQIQQARKHKKRIVLLWFGSIKNAKSTYAPAWVLGDRRRFPRAEIRPSSLPFAKGHPPLSVFNKDLVAADAKAFAKLMEYLARIDPQHTVIAVQVENETGILGDSRDRSPLAEIAWKSPVPSNLVAYLAQNKERLAPSLKAVWARNGYRRSGTWAQIFGEDWQAEEIFMAWHVGRLVQQVAAAGQQHLPLPMYANAWVGPQKAGEPAGNYPSGGPVPSVMDIWDAAAPDLSWLSPDIYVDDFAAWAAAYARAGNPLFVPEARFIVGNLFVALGQYRAIGFSPFGIEAGLPDSQIAQAYALLQGAVPIIANAQASNAITGFVLKPGETHETTFDDYHVTVRGQRESLSKTLLDMGISIPTQKAEPKPQNIGDHAPEMTDDRPMGLILPIGPGEFLIIGKDLSIDFKSRKSGDQSAEIERVEEGRYVDGAWVAGRVLNGDERLRIVPSQTLGMVRVKLFRAAR